MIDEEKNKSETMVVASSPPKRVDYIQNVLEKMSLQELLSEIHERARRFLTDAFPDSPEILDVVDKYAKFELRYEDIMEYAASLPNSKIISDDRKAVVVKGVISIFIYKESDTDESDNYEIKSILPYSLLESLSLGRICDNIIARYFEEWDKYKNSWSYH